MGSLGDLIDASPVYRAAELVDLLHPRTWFSLIETWMAAAPIATIYTMMGPRQTFESVRSVTFRWLCGMLYAIAAAELLVWFWGVLLEPWMGYTSLRPEHWWGEVGLFFLKGMTNSSSATVLASYLICLPALMWKAIKNRVWWFPTVHMCSIVLITIIYHGGVVNGVLLHEMQQTKDMQKALLETISVWDQETVRTTEAITKWKWFAVREGKIEEVEGLSLGEQAKKKLIDELKASQSKVGVHAFVSRETKIKKGEVACIASYKLNGQGDGVLLVDVKKFARFFVKTDWALSAMLVAAHTLWMGFVLALLIAHRHVIASCKTKEKFV
jgi:hypothetical protein